jgi:hypothetical protein
MKLLFDESGALLARYGNPSPIIPFEPVAQPGQILMEVPEGVIGEAVVRVSDGEFIIDDTIITSEWNNIRQIRNKRLAETDWICSITDYEVPNKAGWIAYRQALRDITKGANPFAETLRSLCSLASPHPCTDVSSDVASVPAVASSEVGDAPSM